MSNIDFQAMAKKAVKIAMVRHDLTYGELSAKLAEHGVDMNEQVLRNKISRGTFSAAYMLELLWVMGERNLEFN